MTSIIDQLKQKHWLSQGGQCTQKVDLQSTGYKALDQAIQGGWPLNGIIEVCSPLAIGELRLLAPALSNADGRLNVLIAPPAQISGVFLAQQGIKLEQLLVLHPKSHKDMLWAMETCLKSGTCGNVLAWPTGAIQIGHSKRLKMASEQGESRCFIMTQKASDIPLPVDLGLTLSAHDLGLEVRIHKRKQGFPSEVFTLDMSEHWPRLAITQAAENVIHLDIHRRARAS